MEEQTPTRRQAKGQSQRMSISLSPDVYRALHLRKNAERDTFDQVIRRLIADADTSGKETD